MNARLEQIFHDLADLPPDARSRYYERHAVHPTLQSEVEALLAFDANSALSFSTHIREVAQRILDSFDSKDVLCGPYRLGALLGRGGMGTVYAAEHPGDASSRRLAIKIMRLGLDHVHAHQRFRAEQEILATLSHPHIAGLIDAGELEDGRPYLVMEYVDGKPIDIFAESLTTREKLRLSLQVCRTIGYLHKHLVVHRDLKPGNILVSASSGPKIIDFGIAKRLNRTGDSTVAGLQMLTPSYASPEQLGGKSVSTATDIYSMGAILYKLLTGVSPHRFETDSVCDIVSTLPTPEVAKPSELKAELKGDLEAIVMKTLQKDPPARYMTIEALGDDIENYLASRPIRARKETTWSRTRKALRRLGRSIVAVIR